MFASTCCPIEGGNSPTRIRKPCSRQLLKVRPIDLTRTIKSVIEKPLRRPSGGFLTLQEVCAILRPHQNELLDSVQHSNIYLSEKETPTLPDKLHSATDGEVCAPSRSSVEDFEDLSSKKQKEVERTIEETQQVNHPSFITTAPTLEAADNVRRKSLQISNPYAPDSIKKMTALMLDYLTKRSNDATIRVLLAPSDAILPISSHKRKGHSEKKISTYFKFLKLKCLRGIQLLKTAANSKQPSHALQECILGIGGVSHVLATGNANIAVKIQV